MDAKWLVETRGWGVILKRICDAIIINTNTNTENNLMRVVISLQETKLLSRKMFVDWCLLVYFHQCNTLRCSKTVKSPLQKDKNEDIYSGKRTSIS